MNPFAFLPFALLALLKFSNANAIIPRQESSECQLSTIVLCIVNLGELPMSITACTDIAEDITNVVESGVEAGNDPNNSTSANALANNIFKLATQGADCIVEASMEANDLNEHCVTCAKAIQSAAGEGSG
ncbi:hypothetical protein SCHPADRAFT_1002852 [Schizopora paradoxa]|uniref:Fungal calcium binding protein domain-containing protein n=1 Tax=Schizopora paradoxa TaxID=27342 RepID=A0A0H2R2G4_9AGAM|nr:hypothetical protein SCHPADRAFT_1002852 [Schizopora paradoxa]